MENLHFLSNTLSMLEDLQEKNQLATQLYLGFITLLNELVVPFWFGRLDWGRRSGHILTIRVQTPASCLPCLDDFHTAVRVSRILTRFLLLLWFVPGEEDSFLIIIIIIIIDSSSKAL